MDNSERIYALVRQMFEGCQSYAVARDIIQFQFELEDFDRQGFYEVFAECGRLGLDISLSQEFVFGQLETYVFLELERLKIFEAIFGGYADKQSAILGFVYTKKSPRRPKRR